MYNKYECNMCMNSLYSLKDFQRLCDKLKKNNNKIEKENAELRKKEICLKSEIENLNSSYANEVSKYLYTCNNINNTSLNYFVLFFWKYIILNKKIVLKVKIKFTNRLNYEFACKSFYF